MICPAPGVAFTEAADGDMRSDLAARRAAAGRLGIPSGWATADQVHGSSVVEVSAAGPEPAADALVTITPGLPLAVVTADCLGVVIHGRGGAAVAHAGWRGLAAGVVEQAAARLAATGVEPAAAWIGPSIGPCCFAVGPEVAERFPDQQATTTGGAPSVDLGAAVRARLAGLAIWEARICTACGPGFSHRKTGTRQRLAALAWLEL